MGMMNMLVELKQKSQVTIPSELVKKLKLKPGDKLEVEEKDYINHEIRAIANTISV
jgi:AbrB family looped-hinge helix DNA binding protein